MLFRSLNGEVFGADLPLIGDALRTKKAGNLIEDFRLSLLQPLADEITESNLSLKGLLDRLDVVIRTELKELKLFDEGENRPTLYQFLNKAGGTADTLDNAHAIQFDVVIGQKRPSIPLKEVGLDLGIPLLGLKAEIQPNIQIGWNLKLGFGIDVDQGFYLVSGAPGTKELTFDLDVDLGDAQAAPAQIDAFLTLLRLRLTDGVDLDGSEVIEKDEQTRLHIKASLDIQEASAKNTKPKAAASPQAASTDAEPQSEPQTGPDPRADGRLTVAELISQSPRDTFQFELSGEANLLAKGRLSLEIGRAHV